MATRSHSEQMALHPTYPFFRLASVVCWTSSANSSPAWRNSLFDRPEFLVFGNIDVSLDQLANGFFHLWSELWHKLLNLFFRGGEAAVLGCWGKLWVASWC